jgi:ribosomal protein L34E
MCNSVYIHKNNLLISSVKTPGGKLTYQYVKKRGTVPKCGDCKVELPGVNIFDSIFIDLIISFD